MADESVKLRCTNPACAGYTHDDEDALEFRIWWHPATYTEYQGVFPHGGRVQVYTDGAFECQECQQEGVEIGT
jgi:hypothetical protein